MAHTSRDSQAYLHVVNGNLLKCGYSSHWFTLDILSIEHSLLILFPLGKNTCTQKEPMHACMRCLPGSRHSKIINQGLMRRKRMLAKNNHRPFCLFCFVFPNKMSIRGWLCTHTSDSVIWGNRTQKVREDASNGANTGTFCAPIDVWRGGWS